MVAFPELMFFQQMTPTFQQIKPSISTKDPLISSEMEKEVQCCGPLKGHSFSFSPLLPLDKKLGK